MHWARDSNPLCRNIPEPENRFLANRFPERIFPQNRTKFLEPLGPFPEGNDVYSESCGWGVGVLKRSSEVQMRKAGFGIIVAVAITPMTGCGIFQAVEQWKCDNLGMCHFGTTPSAPGCNSCGPPPPPLPPCGSGGCGDSAAPPPFEYQPVPSFDPYATN